MADKNVEILISAEDQASNVLQGIGKNMGKLEDQIKFTGTALTAIGVATGLFAKATVDASAQMEQQAVAFNTLTGSAEKGRQTLGDLITFASSTPFEIPQILEQSKRLLAMGTTADDLIPTFRALGDVAAGVGMEKLPQLVLAFGQIQATGRLMGTELRQLTEAGFNLADAMGITNQELREMVENGEVSFDDVKRAFMNVTSEGGRFNDMMQNASQTTAGKLSNLSDNVFRLKDAIGDTLRPAVNQIVTALIPFVEKMAQFAKDNPQLVTVLIGLGIALGVIGVAMLALLPIILAFQLGLLPIYGVVLLVVAGIALLIGAGYLLIQNWQTIQTVALQVWTMIVTTISTALTNIQTFFVTIWTQIFTWLVETWNNFINNTFVSLFIQLVSMIINWLLVIKQAFELAWFTIISIVTIAVYAVLAVINAVMNIIYSVINVIMNAIKAIISAIWNAIKGDVMAILNAIKEIVSFVWEGIKTIITTIMTWIAKEINKKMNESSESVNSGVNQMKGFFSSLIGAIESVISWFNRMADAARNALNAAREAVNGAVSGARGALGFQHGGVIPGRFNQAVPAVLHGGERVIPRTGVDVNQSSGGGGSTVNIIIEGDVNSMDTLDRIVETVKNSIGRDNELVQLGVTV